MPSFTCLPAEIIHDIVDSLSLNTSTLQSVALVNQLLLSSARRHLFHTINLSSARLCAVFDNVLRAASSLGSYVRCLTLSESGWLDATLPGTLIGPKLTSLHSLSLLHVDWTALSELSIVYLTTHFTSIHTLELQHPVLQDWGDLVYLLSPRAYLHTFTLGRVRLRGPIRPPDRSGHGVARGVRVLSTAGPSLHDSVDALLAWLPDLRPRTLRVQTIEDTHVPDVARLLRAQGTALGAFEMCTWAFHAPAWQDALEPHGALLRHNTGLRSLSLVSLFIYPGAPPLLPQLPLVLAQVSGDSLLTLSIELFFTHDSSVLPDLAAVGWVDVRAVLERPTFSSLRTLRVAFEYETKRHTEVTQEQVEKRMRELLPEAYKREILVVERTQNHFK